VLQINVVDLIYQNKPTMTTNYQKPNCFEKLTKNEILEAMQNGAILTKTYGVYSYWDLTFPDGTRHYNIRKGSTNGISNLKNVVLFDRNKKGFSYKFNA